MLKSIRMFLYIVISIPITYIVYNNPIANLSLGIFLTIISILITIFVFVFGFMNDIVYGKKIFSLFTSHYPIKNKILRFFLNYRIDTLIIMLIPAFFCPLIYYFVYDDSNMYLVNVLLTYICVLSSLTIIVVYINVFLMIIFSYRMSFIKSFNENDKLTDVIINKIDSKLIIELFIDYNESVDSKTFKNICFLFQHLYIDTNRFLSETEKLVSVVDILNSKIDKMNLGSYENRIILFADTIQIDFIQHITNTLVFLHKENNLERDCNESYRIKTNDFVIFNKLISNLRDELVDYIVMKNSNVIEFIAENYYGGTDKVYYINLLGKYVSKNKKKLNTANYMSMDNYYIKSDLQIFSYILAMINNNISLKNSGYFSESKSRNKEDNLMDLKKVLILEKILYFMKVRDIEQEHSIYEYQLDCFEYFVNSLFDISISRYRYFLLEEKIENLKILEEYQNKYLEQYELSEYANETRSYILDIYFSRLLSVFSEMILSEMKQKIENIKFYSETVTVEEMQSILDILDYFNCIESENIWYIKYTRKSEETLEIFNGKNIVDYFEFIDKARNSKELYYSDITNLLIIVLEGYKSSSVLFNDVRDYMINKCKSIQENDKLFRFVSETKKVESNKITELHESLEKIGDYHRVIPGKKDEYLKIIDELILKINDSDSRFIRWDNEYYNKQNLLNYFRPLLSIDETIYINKIKSVNNSKLLNEWIGYTSFEYYMEYKVDYSFFYKNGVLESTLIENELFQRAFNSYLENNVVSNKQKDLNNLDEYILEKYSFNLEYISEIDYVYLVNELNLDPETKQALVEEFIISNSIYVNIIKSNYDLEVFSKFMDTQLKNNREFIGKILKSEFILSYVNYYASIVEYSGERNIGVFRFKELNAEDLQRLEELFRKYCIDLVKIYKDVLLCDNSFKGTISDSKNIHSCYEVVMRIKSNDTNLLDDIHGDLVEIINKFPFPIELISKK